MQSLSNDETKRVLGEVLSDQLNVIIEYVKVIPRIEKRVCKLEEDMQEVKSDLKVIKYAVTDMGQQLKDHDKRLVRLETACPSQP